MLPEKELKEMSNVMSLGETMEGIGPEKLLCCKCANWSEGIERMLEGNVPLRPLE